MATQASDSIKQKSRATTADELAVVAQRAQAFTNASGAAIAISEGNTDEIVCRARSGGSAPDVGTALRVEGTFTGICIQSGKELRCDDAETDTRGDTGAIRALGIRSMVVTPIKEEGKVVGVLAVFAPTPHAFTITHVAVLKTMADQIAGLLQKERRTKDEQHFEPPPPPPVVQKAPSPVKAVPQPVVIKPSTAQPLAASVAAAPARSYASPVSSAETMRPVPVAVEVPPPVVVPKKEKKREPKPELQAAPKLSLGTLDTPSGEPPKVTVSKIVMVAVAAVVVLGGSIWGFVKMHKSASAATVQSVQPSQTTPSSQPTVSATPVAAVTTAPAPNSSISAPANNRSNNSEKPESRKNSDQERNKPSPAPAPTTVALASGPSKISAGTPQDQAPVAAPNFSVGGSSEITSLARPVNSSTPAMLAQSDLVNARAIRTAPAIYPGIAKARRISGTVVVRITVGKDGKVTNPKFISGPAIFEDAAFDAVKQWVFKPATLNGQPIEQDTEIRVNFHPN